MSNISFESATISEICGTEKTMHTSGIVRHRYDGVAQLLKQATIMRKFGIQLQILYKFSECKSENFAMPRTGTVPRYLCRKKKAKADASVYTIYLIFRLDNSNFDDSNILFK